MSANGGSTRDRHRARSLSSASNSVRRRPLSARSVNSTTRRLPVKRRLFTPRTPQSKSVEVSKSPDGGGCGSITVPASSSPTVINVHCDGASKRCSPSPLCNPCNTCPVFDQLGFPHYPVYSPPVWVTTFPLACAPSMCTPYLPPVSYLTQVPYLPPLAPIPECTSIIPYPACPDPWLNRNLLPQVCW